MNLTTLTLPQRREALAGLIVILALMVLGGCLGLQISNDLVGSTRTYGTQVKQRLDPMLASLGQGQVRSMITHRRCYGQDRFSPCAVVMTTQNQVLQVMGPDLRVAVALTWFGTKDAIRLKKTADELDSLPDFPALGRDVVTAIEAPGSLPEIVVSTAETVDASGFSAQTVSLDGAALNVLRPQATWYERLWNRSRPARVELLWFSVPFSMTGEVLQVQHDRPMAQALRAQP